MAHLGRRTTDFAQKIKGRSALRFQLELIPYTLDGVPSSAKQASFMWERGTKLQYTDPVPVNNGLVYWGNTLLKQTATVYRDGDSFKPKEYWFKIQDIGHNKKRQTFAKCKINLAKYCSCELNELQEVIIPVSGAGNLKISITATWLKHSSPDNDAITEISALSMGNKSGTSSMNNEQDLSGFESHQSKIHRQRQRQGLPSPFVPDGSPNFSMSPSPEISPSRQRQPSIGGGKSGGLSLKITPEWKKKQSRFQDVDLNTVEEEEVTPRMFGQKQAGNAQSNPTHVRQVSGASFQSTEIYSSRPQNPNESRETFADLISSDSEEENGVIASTKRWFKTGKQRPGNYPMEPRLPSTGVSGLPSELDLMNMEDVSALRQLARQALRERDNEILLRQQAERQHRHLQADCEALSECECCVFCS